MISGWRRVAWSRCSRDHASGEKRTAGQGRPWHTLGGLLVLILTANLLAAAPDPAEWPRFRGPNGSGISEAAGFPVQWTEKDYAWKVALPGGGHSSPVLWGDRLFITSSLDEAGKLIILCLKAADGSTLWKREYDAVKGHRNDLNCIATTTPSLDADALYVSWASPEKYMLVAIDHAGQEIWQRDLGPFVSQHGHGGSSPIVCGDVVVLENDQEGKGYGVQTSGQSFAVGLDRKTGRTRWQLDRGSAKASYGTPCIYQPAGGPPQVILASMAGGLTSIDPQTAKVNWEVRDAFPRRVVASPVVAGDLILGQCGDGASGIHVIAVRPPAKGGQPEVAYKVTKSAPYVPMPVVRGDLVFLVSDTGMASCIKFATGEEVWRERIPSANFYGSPVWLGGKLYAISTKGEVIVWSAGEKFEVLARNPLGEKSHATPAIAGGRMFLRTWSHLFALAAK
jgi:outer membrane protein assembly factor BamB